MLRCLDVEEASFWPFFIFSCVRLIRRCFTSMILHVYAHDTSKYVNGHKSRNLSSCCIFQFVTDIELTRSWKKVILDIKQKSFIIWYLYNSLQSLLSKLIRVVFSGKNMKNCDNRATFIVVVVLIIFNSEVNGVLFDAPQNDCNNNQQCKYGICRKVNNPICSAGSNW